MKNAGSGLLTPTCSLGERLNVALPMLALLATRDS